MEDWSPGVHRSIYQWLRMHGFEDNPFATSDAANEKFLRSVFVDTGKLEWVRGDPIKPQTVLFFAYRGCGKTAHRRMIEFDACPLNRNGTTLAVVYDELDHWRRIPHPPTPEDHLRVILQRGIEALLETVANWNRKIISPSSEFFGELKQLCLEFAPDSLHPVSLSRRFNRLLLQAPSFEPRSEEIKRALEGRHLITLFEGQIPVENQDKVLFFARLADATPTDYGLQPHPLRCAVEIFVELALTLGLGAVYVLVDGVDEVILPSSLDWIDCLESLLADLHLMRMEGLAFKFFLPEEMRLELFAKQWVRPDKLTYATLTWSESDLKSLLEYRLVAFNNAGVNSLRGMCEPKLARVIDDELIRNAQGIPRRLLLLGNRLLGVHCQQDPLKEFVTYAEWLRSVEEVEEVLVSSNVQIAMPYLRVARTRNIATVGSRRLRLTRQEYLFLLCLAEHAGVCEKEQIVDQVYDTEDGVTDNAIASLVKRLRKKLEPDSENPYYLRTVHGRGFSLHRWELIE